MYFKSFLLLVPVVLCDYLLVQKQPIINMLSDSYLKKNSIRKLAFFSNDYQIYTVTDENYSRHFHEIRSTFYIEHDQIVKLDPPHIESYFNHDESQFVFGPLRSSVPWHLDRIDSNTLDDSYMYNTTGSCHRNTSLQIDTYVIDTGIDVDHPQFEGRAEWLVNYAGDSDDTDGNGHGTHCSGLVGSSSFGVCKDAKLYAIKVLDSEGSGTLSGVIRGIEHAFNVHMTKSNSLHNSGRDVKSIISMSLGGGYSRIVNKAVENCLTSSDSFYVVVASGNENDNACKTSPASAKGVFSVMAMNTYDERAYFSNFGKCADIYSPGVDVESTIPNSKSAVYSGTSMATPIVAGVLNHYIDMYPHMNMEAIKNKILMDAHKNLIKNNKKSTKNLLVYLQR